MSCFTARTKNESRWWKKAAPAAPHGRPADEGADRPGGSAALPGGLPRQHDRAVAGQALPRFHLPLEILTKDKFGTARSGNWFLETNLVPTHLDKLSPNEDIR